MNWGRAAKQNALRRNGFVVVGDARPFGTAARKRKVGKKNGPKLSDRQRDAERDAQTCNRARVQQRTAEEIENGKSERGAWTRKQLAEWGVPWPPPQGWKLALVAGENPKSAKMRRKLIGNAAQIRWTDLPT
jgi:hypothetical protein